MKNEAVTTSFIWYVSYGSNLNKQRFHCYIEGGTPAFGNKSSNGCQDKALPVANRPITINYQLYFALPDRKTETQNWGAGGVAFIDSQYDPSAVTLCRMWKITEDQYADVKKQEGAKWYGNEIDIGEEDGIPILTITNNSLLTNIICPSDSYLKTIMLGLKETYCLTDDQIVEYLVSKSGINDNLGRPELLSLLSVISG